MKIKINKEKYLNNPCPKITKEMWDWFYDTLYVSARDSGSLINIKKIDTIDIRINQAYDGCPNIHFYVSINGNSEFHKDYFYAEEQFDYKGWRKKYRYDWIRDFIKIGGIDMGTTKPLERYDERWRIFREKANTKKRVKKLVDDWKQYQKLHDFFTQ